MKPLSDIERRILNVLQAQPDVWISTADLGQLGWGYPVDASNVSMAVGSIRRKLGVDGRLLCARRYHGYCWASVDPGDRPPRAAAVPTPEPKHCAVCGGDLATHWRCAGCHVLGHTIARGPGAFCTWCIKDGKAGPRAADYDSGQDENNRVRNGTIWH